MYHELSIDAKCIKILFNFNDGSFLLKEVHGIYYHIHSITHKIVLRKHILLNYNYNFFWCYGQKTFPVAFQYLFFRSPPSFDIVITHAVETFNDAKFKTKKQHFLDCINSGCGIIIKITIQRKSIAMTEGKMI